MNNVVELPAANRLNNLMQALNQEYALVFIGSSLRILREKKDPATGKSKLLFLSPQDFRTFTKNQFTGDATARSVADFFLTHPGRRQFDRIDFIPGPTPEGVYNLWKGFAVEAKQGVTEKFWAFVLEIICAGDKKAYGFVRKWLAHLVQHPNKLPGTALVLRGKQGTGKNTFAEAIGELCGDHFASVVSLDQITGRFNAHLGNILLVHANEAIWGGNKATEGALKAMITDDLMPYEAKGRDITYVHNYKRVIASSNEDWAVPRGLDDRRFFVLDVSDAHKEDQVYFAALHEELKNGGYAALIYDLKHEDLTDFNPRVIPITSAGLDMKLKSTTNTIRWLYEFLKDGYRMANPSKYETPLELVATGGEVEKDRVYENYGSFCAAVDRSKQESRSQFWRALKQSKLGLKDVRPSDGNRHRAIVFPPLADARVAFEKLLKQPNAIDWEE